MKTWRRVGRIAAALIAVLVPACGNGGAGGSGSGDGILWNSQSGSFLGNGGPVPTGSALWVDPNSGLGGGPLGVTQPVVSIDVASYARFNIANRPPPYNQFVSYILGHEHPLATDTSSSPITIPESRLLGLINGVRGGDNAVNPLNPVLPQSGSTVLSSFQKGTLAARAHCKHYAYFHPGPMPGESYNTHPPLPANNFVPQAPWIFSGLVPTTQPAPRYTLPPTNFEGDHVIWTAKGSPADMTNVPGMITSNTAGVNPLNPLANHGRLGKIGVRTDPVVGEFSYSGPEFEKPESVFEQMMIDDPSLIRLPIWTHVVVGHWRGGTRAFYWNILFLKNPRSLQ
jgi:hypothetical protein